MSTDNTLVGPADELRLQAALLRTPEFMVAFDAAKFADQLDRIAKRVEAEVEHHKDMAAKWHGLVDTWMLLSRTADTRASRATKLAEAEVSAMRMNLQGCMEALSNYAPDCLEVECARKILGQENT